VDIESLRKVVWGKLQVVSVLGRKVKEMFIIVPAKGRKEGKQNMKQSDTTRKVMIRSAKDGSEIYS